MQTSNAFGLLTASLAHIGFYSLMRPGDSVVAQGTVTFLVVLFICYGAYWALIDLRKKAPLLQKMAWVVVAFITLVGLHFILGLGVLYLPQTLPFVDFDWADLGQFERLYRRSYIPVFMGSVAVGHVVKFVVDWQQQRNTVPL